MAECLALFFAALIAVSQAAPRPQDDVNSSSQPASSNTGPSPSADGTSQTSNAGAGFRAPGMSSGTADPPGPVAIIIPPELLSNFFRFVSTAGTTTNGGSSNSPLAAIISVIPNAINAERERFGKAVQALVQDNTAAIGDMIDSAATTGGKLLSNGVKLVGTWPTFFGHLIG